MGHPADITNYLEILKLKLKKKKKGIHLLILSHSPTFMINTDSVGRNSKSRFIFVITPVKGE